MMQQGRILLAMVLLQVALAPAAHADTIVDTGTPTYQARTDNWAIFNVPGLGISGSIAGEFTTTQSFAITSLAAYVAIFSGTIDPGPQTDAFELSIAQGTPSAAGGTFTTLFTVPVSFTTNLEPDGTLFPGWATASVPSYLLPSGTYWIVASVGDNDFAPGLGVLGTAPNPLSAYANGPVSNDDWQPLPGAYFNGDRSAPGFQVEGNPVSPVPLPDTLTLFLSGLGVLVALRSRNLFAEFWHG
jgi:hypothetical protein